MSWEIPPLESAFDARETGVMLGDGDAGEGLRRRDEQLFIFLFAI